NDQLALCRDHISGEQVVASEPVFACKPAVASPKSNARNTRIRSYAHRGGKPERVSLTVEFSESHARLGTCGAAGHIDAYPLHSGEVNQQTALWHALSRNVVSPSPYRNCQVMLASKFHHVHHVTSAVAMCN